MTPAISIKAIKPRSLNTCLSAARERNGHFERKPLNVCQVLDHGTLSLIFRL